jgi:ethanolamine utilization protein EutN
MLLAHVVGNVVASLKESRLTGMKLLLVREVSEQPDSGDVRPFVAVDLVGAGQGETVIVARGMPAALAVADGAPIDAAIVGIVDASTPLLPSPVGRQSARRDRGG